MHLIAPLAAGIEGCESGTFDIVLRGTSTPASYYTDFEGLTSPITGTGVALDSRGGGIFYVNALVKVTAKSSAGATVREFIAGDAATCNEIRSSSITGTHYQSGAVAAGNPTTVKAWADMWFASAGAVDFKVLYGGAATNLSTVVGALSGQRRFVVTEYGAVGNGVANDLSAINAAISAANAAGGGIVYFPPGTYLVNSSITAFTTVSLEGAGPKLTTIRCSVNLPFINGACPSVIRGLKFTYTSATYTFQYITIPSAGAGDTVLIEQCDFAVNTSGSIVSGSSANAHTVRVIDCTMTTTGNGVIMTGTSTTLEVSGCVISSSAVGGGAGAGLVRASGRTRISNTVFDCSATTSGTQFAVYNAGSDTMVVVGCDFRPPATSVTRWVQFVTDTASSLLVESGNSVRGTLNNRSAALALGATGYDVYSLALNLSAANSNLCGSREGATAFPVNGDADPIVVPLGQAGHCSVRVTSTAAHAGNVGINASDRAPTGAKATLSVWNDTGGAITFQWGNNINSTATFAVAANSIRSFLLVMNECDPAGTDFQWFLASDLAGAELTE